LWGNFLVKKFFILFDEHLATKYKNLVFLMEHLLEQDPFRLMAIVPSLLHK
jgi:hypothetical protein